MASGIHVDGRVVNMATNDCDSSIDYLENNSWTTNNDTVESVVSLLNIWIVHYYGPFVNPIANLSDFNDRVKPWLTNLKANHLLEWPDINFPSVTLKSPLKSEFSTCRLGRCDRMDTMVDQSWSLAHPYWNYTGRVRQHEGGGGLPRPPIPNTRSSPGKPRIAQFFSHVTMKPPRKPRYEQIFEANTNKDDHGASKRGTKRSVPTQFELDARDHADAFKRMDATRQRDTIHRRLEYIAQQQSVCVQQEPIKSLIRNSIDKHSSINVSDGLKRAQLMAYASAVAACQVGVQASSDMKNPYDFDIQQFKQVNISVSWNRDVAAPELPNFYNGAMENVPENLIDYVIEALAADKADQREFSILLHYNDTPGNFNVTRLIILDKNPPEYSKQSSACVINKKYTNITDERRRLLAIYQWDTKRIDLRPFDATPLPSEDEDDDDEDDDEEDDDDEDDDDEDDDDEDDDGDGRGGAIVPFVAADGDVRDALTILLEALTSITKKINKLLKMTNGCINKALDAMTGIYLTLYRLSTIHNGAINFYEWFVAKAGMHRIEVLARAKSLVSKLFIVAKCVVLELKKSDVVLACVLANDPNAAKYAMATTSGFLYDVAHTYNNTFFDNIHWVCKAFGQSLSALTPDYFGLPDEIAINGYLAAISGLVFQRIVRKCWGDADYAKTFNFTNLVALVVPMIQLSQQSKTAIFCEAAMLTSAWLASSATLGVSNSILEASKKMKHQPYNMLMIMAKNMPAGAFNGFCGSQLFQAISTRMAHYFISTSIVPAWLKGLDENNAFKRMASANNLLRALYSMVVNQLAGTIYNVSDLPQQIAKSVRSQLMNLDINLKNPRIQILITAIVFTFITVKRRISPGMRKRTERILDKRQRSTEAPMVHLEQFVSGAVKGKGATGRGGINTFVSVDVDLLMHCMGTAMVAGFA